MSDIKRVGWVEPPIVPEALPSDRPRGPEPETLPTGTADPQRPPIGRAHERSKEARKLTRGLSDIPPSQVQANSYAEILGLVEDIRRNLPDPARNR